MQAPAECKPRPRDDHGTAAVRLSGRLSGAVLAQSQGEEFSIGDLGIIALALTHEWVDQDSEMVMRGLGVFRWRTRSA
jgi:hypothetical protein